MCCPNAEYARLALLVQRLLDGDRLSEDYGAALLAEAEAACLLSEAGDAAGARRHVEHVALLTEALVLTDALGPSEGRTLLGAAEGILHSEAGGDIR